MKYTECVVVTVPNPSKTYRDRPIKFKEESIGDVMSYAKNMITLATPNIIILADGYKQKELTLNKFKTIIVELFNAICIKIAGTIDFVL